jgi:hypothetical protein
LHITFEACCCAGIPWFVSPNRSRLENQSTK